MSRYLSKAREPLSSLTHLIGAIVFGLGTIFIIIKACVGGAPPVSLVSGIIFGLSLIMLYSSSAIYHFVRASDKVIFTLRKLDHAMIYVLIAGSYTPILLHYFPAPNNYIFTALIWAIGLTGIAAKLLWFNAPRILYTFFYIFMGWFIMFDLPSLALMDIGALMLLIGGGVAYTAGGVIYAIKKPVLTETFGFHELFHVLVLLGSLLHYLIVVLYVL